MAAKNENETKKIHTRYTVQDVKVKDAKQVWLCREREEDAQILPLPGGYSFVRFAGGSSSEITDIAGSKPPKDVSIWYWNQSKFWIICTQY